MRNELVELISIENGQDADGFPIATEFSFECFADIQSAKRAEFYEAAKAGYDIKVICVVSDEDYQSAIEENGRKPTRVRYNDTLFRVLRDYKVKAKKSVELTLIEGD